MGPDRTALESREAGEHSVDEPGLRERLIEERRRRESLERRVQELTDESRRSRQQSEQTDRFSRIQGALQELGVKKVQLAFRLVKDDVFRGEDGELYVDAAGERIHYRDYLRRFVSENAEFLPPRIAGGSGARDSDHGELAPAGFDLDRIRPGMSKEELAQAWKEVARLAGHGSNSW